MARHCPPCRPVSIPAQGGVSGGRLHPRFVWRQRVVDRIGRSPMRCSSGTAESPGIHSWAPRQGCSVVRHRLSVMTKRVRSQDGIAVRSPVVWIRPGDRGRRPNHPHPTERLVRGTGWKRGRVIPQVRLCGTPDGVSYCCAARQGCIGCRSSVVSKRGSSPDGSSRDDSRLKALPSRKVRRRRGSTITDGRSRSQGRVLKSVVGNRYCLTAR